MIVNFAVEHMKVYESLFINKFKMIDMKNARVFYDIEFHHNNEASCLSSMFGCPTRRLCTLLSLAGSKTGL